MNKKTIIAWLAILAIAVLVSLPSEAQRRIFYNPILRGEVEGTSMIQTFYVGDPTADTWILGDTTAAGMYVPEQAMELVDLKIFGDPDSGDSLRVIVYDAAAGTGTAAVVCSSDTLVGTTWAQVDDQTVSTTYGIVDATEGLGILLDFIAGTPNSVWLTLEWKLHQTDYME